MIAYHRTAAMGWNPARAQFQGSQAVLSGPFPRALLTGYGLGQVGNDLEFCKKVRCGVVLQHETTLDRITGCHSNHPETRGALSWCDPRCSEFWAELASRQGVHCQAAAAMSPTPAPAIVAAPATFRPGQPRPHPILFVPGPPVSPRWSRPKCGPVKNGCGCNGHSGCGCKKGSGVNGGNGDTGLPAGLGSCVGWLLGGLAVAAVFGGSR